jgi:phospholipid/cholesterol/gamma-HCH transport system substrate-binding protein
MASVRTNFSVGLFVISGMTLVIVFILWLGMSQYFKAGRHYEAFFDESVQGLKEDSAVKYRGVAIGRVETIQVAKDGRLIRILLNLDEPLIDHDQMIAQIKSIGITGIMFLEIERMRPGDKSLSPKITFETKFPVIATRSSDIKQLMTDINDILNKIKQIDMKGISDRVVETLDKANQTFADAEVKKVSESLQKTLTRSQEILDTEKWKHITANLHQASRDLNILMKSTGTTIKTIDESLKTHNQKLSATIDEFKNAAQNASKMMEGGKTFISDAQSRVSRIDQRLLETLETLTTTAENLNLLIAQIKDQPSALIFSSPPEPKPIEPESSVFEAP